jgi:hypothetical protein
MSENNNKPPEKLPLITPPTPPTPDQQRNLAFAQAIANLNNRMTMAEIEIHKANSNNEILKATIDLIEKRMDFNEKT